MQNLRFFFLVIAFHIAATGSAQFIVTGTVLDSATREPLSPASVFCQNTTLGTTTNKQGEFSINLKSGGYDLVFSYTGYITQTVRVTENNRLDILLVKEEKSLGEVVLKNTYEVTDGWTKHGDFFFKNFIGSTPNANACTLDNPEALKFFFYKRSNRLKVTATEPVRISNNTLGYSIHYLLDSFVYYYNTELNLYRGYCLFTEMDGPDSMKLKWHKNRQRTYAGSKLQFMRSYYDSTLAEDGWIIDMLNENSDKKFSKVTNPYDTTYYGALDSTMQIEIWYPRKISITYTKKKPETEYLKKMGLPKSVPYTISYIELKDAIAIMENGYYYDQKDWVNQGYWSWKNLADLLPYDYVPPE
jgi:CarboxypepD_reg-like domain